MQLQPPLPKHDWLAELADDFAFALIH